MRIPETAKIIFESAEIINIERKSKELAKFFFNCNMDKNSRVGVLLNRSPILIISILALMRMGIPFIGIDHLLPSKRIEYIIEDSNLTHIVTDYRQNFSNGNKNLNVIYINNYKELGVDNEDIILNVNNNIIYMIYTSGSSGVPKGISIKKCSFYTFVNSISKILNFLPKQKMLCITSVNFDIFLLESIIPLLLGMTIVLGGQNEINNPKKIHQLIVKNAIDIIQITPSRIRLLLEFNSEFFSNTTISKILIGGEPLSLSVLQNIKRTTNAEIYNLYGPSETTIWSTVSNLTNQEDVNIGLPIDGTRIYILGEEFKPVKNGDIGEICIAGSGLAEGYINNNKLTKEVFCDNSNYIKERFYRTGDLGKFENGNLIYCGRKDNQIKLRGYRIELEEIEFNINNISGIVNSVAIVKNDLLFVLYCGTTSQHTIRSNLKQLLPHYMIPNFIIKIENIPLTYNGKIDRKKTLNFLEEICNGKNKQ